ncbi:conserved oligomeric Golgi complex subunit 2-like [Hibiscus syriacus]|uniref:Conserved oligomeric Golgi complex subunit 2-like n=1 Tax=Hibiscus syriacus TaxID=106335 RepID=A0A6A2XCU2_HIBSY|nr:conserved oligomeric Golgi complex subunit 2-like [Hibiscus syriacus]
MRNEEYERVLGYFEKDGDGKISAFELRHRWGQMGGKLLLNEAVVAVEALDSNGDGLLDLQDKMKLMEEDNGEEEKLLGCMMKMDVGSLHLKD